MAETWLYRALLKAFPALDYSAHAGRQWGSFFRFDICDEDTGSLYLRRFVLARTPIGSIYLHHIVRSDRDRCLHDHPWNSLIVVLWGGYKEELPEGRVRRNPGSIRLMPAETKHRVVLWNQAVIGDDGRLQVLGPIPAWTLCCVGKKVRSWGFWRKGSFIPWREFLAGDREC